MPSFFRRLRFGEKAQLQLERALLAVTVLVVLYLVFVFLGSLLFQQKAAFQEHLRAENFYPTQ